MGTPNFNPLPPHGGRRVSQDSYNPRISFQSTPSAWRETFAFFTVTVPSLFQSTPSAWRETASADSNAPISVNFNPLPPHGGRLRFPRLIQPTYFISIHSLRMEGDHNAAAICDDDRISIHSLRMEGDLPSSLR